MRDPYNWLASTIKRRDSNYDQLVNKKRIMIEYLEYALHLREYLDSSSVVINYNKWVIDEESRKEICRSLNIPFSDSADKAILEVPNFGGGSSFAGIAPLKDSSVFHRWKEFASDPLYQKIINDDYLIELSKSYFGIDCPI